MLVEDLPVRDTRQSGIDGVSMEAGLVVQGSRRISFREFEGALELLAADKGVPAEQVRQKVAQSSGPLCNATQATHVRLHDDKSTYTGT